MIKAIFLIIIIYCFSLYSPVLAAESSPSAIPSSIKEKLDQLKKEIASKAAQIKQEVNRKLQNKAYAGQVLEVQDSKLILKAKQASRTVLVNEYTLLPKGLTLKKFVKDDFIVALGDVDDKGILTAKKIIKLDKSQENKKIAIWGQVLSISGPTFNIQSKNNQALEVATTSQTVFRSGNQEAILADIKVNRFLVSINESSSSAKSKFIYLIEGGPILKFKKATPSATPKKPN